MKSKQMHKFRKSLNISLVKTSTVLVNCFKSYRQSTVSQKLSRQLLFTLSFVQLLNIYLFSKSFLLPFNQCLGASYLILGAGLVIKAFCCQIILYIYASFCPISNTNFQIQFCNINLTF